MLGFRFSLRWCCAMVYGLTTFALLVCGFSYCLRLFVFGELLLLALLVFVCGRFNFWSL